MLREEINVLKEKAKEDNKEEKPSEEIEKLKEEHKNEIQKLKS
jgi:hypothetical protein